MSASAGLREELHEVPGLRVHLLRLEGQSMMLPAVPACMSACSARLQLCMPSCSYSYSYSVSSVLIAGSRLAVTAEPQPHRLTCLLACSNLT